MFSTHNPTNGLWNIPLAPKEAAQPPTPSTVPKTLRHSAKGAIQDIHTKKDLAAIHHGSAFSPVPSTFLWAIGRGHFQSWPGLTTNLVSKHLAKSLATSKGHLRMQLKNIQSTKIATNLPLLTTSLNVSPSQEPNNLHTNVVFAAIMHFTKQHPSLPRRWLQRLLLRVLQRTALAFPSGPWAASPAVRVGAPGRLSLHRRPYGPTAPRPSWLLARCSRASAQSVRTTMARS